MVAFLSSSLLHLAAFIEISSWSILVEGEGDLIGLKIPRSPSSCDVLNAKMITCT